MIESRGQGVSGAVGDVGVSVGALHADKRDSGSILLAGRDITSDAVWVDDDG